MTAPEILSHVAGLNVALTVEGRQIKARMSRPNLPIPDEARSLIGQIKPHLVQLLADKPAYRRPGAGDRCDWCREWEQAGRHRRAVLACGECDVRS